MRTLKLFLLLTSIMMMPAAHASYYWYNVGSATGAPNSCLFGRDSQTSSVTTACYWCNGSGVAKGGYCGASYAGCVGAEIVDVGVGGIVQSNDNLTRWTCTKSGWEESSFPSTNCYSDWSGNGCKDGCYWNTGAVTCMACPMPDFVLPALMANPITAKAGERSSITDCFIPAIGPFADATGTFEIVEECYYSN